MLCWIWMMCMLRSNAFLITGSAPPLRGSACSDRGIVCCPLMALNETQKDCINSDECDRCFSGTNLVLGTSVKAVTCTNLMIDNAAALNSNAIGGYVGHDGTMAKFSIANNQRILNAKSSGSYFYESGICAAGKQDAIANGWSALQFTINPGPVSGSVSVNLQTAASTGCSATRGNSYVNTGTIPAGQTTTVTIPLTAFAGANVRNILSLSFEGFLPVGVDITIGSISFVCPTTVSTTASISTTTSIATTATSTISTTTSVSTITSIATTATSTISTTTSVSTATSIATTATSTISTTTSTTTVPSPTPTCSYYGFPCCMEIVVNPAIDVNGNAYGMENGVSCIVPPGCKTCVTSNTGIAFPSTAPLNFITRTGNKLYDGSNIFRFISVNVPNFLMLQDRPSTNGFWIPPEAWEQMDAAASVSGLYGRVIRSYTLGFGSGQHVTGIRTYNEAAFVAFDNAVAACKKYNIRLIVPLVNQHNGDDTSTAWYYGDYGIMASWRSKKPSEFFTDATVIADFKHLISFILNRVNTVTGIAYKNDPTFLAWQLGNELGSWTNPTPPSSWLIDIAQYIKSLAPKTLVMDGVIGGTSRFAATALSSSYIDIFTNHYYGNAQALGSDANFVISKNKAFIACEYGFGSAISWYDNVMNTALTNPAISGLLLWSLRYHSYEGGFYVHSEGNGYFSYHVPGFPTAPGFGSEEAQLMPLVRYYGLKIQGLDTRMGYPIPFAPSSAFGSITPQALRWAGSAWAKGYNLERQEVGTAVWTRIATKIMDNVIGPAKIYSDTSAVVGKGYYYRVQAVGVGGAVSGWLTLGPLIA